MIRDERPGDEGAIAALITQAFATSRHGDNGEAAIVEALRAAGALTLSLVAERDGRIVGQVAFSPVTIADGTASWFGLGPLAVAPDEQARGIGAKLVEEGLARLRGQGARGSVLLGDPAYYGRFGFRAEPSLRYPSAPAVYFQALSFTGHIPVGEVAYHAAFG